MKCLIAVDAGGTKIKVRSYASDMHIIKEMLGGCGSPAIDGDNALNRIFGLIKDMKAEMENQGHEVFMVIAGISGLGVVLNAKEREAALAQELGLPVILNNDAIEGVWSVVRDTYKQGIMVICGTGNSCMGIQKDCNPAKLILKGGWGDRIMEKGSAWACVNELILNIVDADEHHKPLTPLEIAFLNKLGYNQPSGIKFYVYAHQKNDIASFAKWVAEEASAGDEEAITILKHNGEYLADQINRTLEDMNLDNKTVLGFRGSFASKVELVRQICLANIKYPIELEAEESDPITGCFYQAKALGF